MICRALQIYVLWLCACFLLLCLQLQQPVNTAYDRLPVQLETESGKAIAKVEVLAEAAGQLSRMAS